MNTPEKTRGPGGGPKPLRMPSEVRQTILDMRGPQSADKLGASEAKVLEELKKRSIAHPDPDKPWTPASVRHAVKAVLAEQKRAAILFRNVLRELESMPAINRSGLVEISARAGVDPYWLLGHPARAGGGSGSGSLIEVDFDADLVTIAPDGRRLAELTESLFLGDRVDDPLTEEDLQALAILSEGRVSKLDALYRRQHSSAHALQSLVTTTRDSAEANPAGRLLGDAWRGLLALLDVRVFPGPPEEASLPARWTWDQRPILP